MKGKLLAFLIPVVYVFALLLVASPSGVFATPPIVENVTICHHNEGSKGFVENTVDIASIFRQNGHLFHQDKADIIPTFTFLAFDTVKEHRHCTNWDSDDDYCRNNSWTEWEIGSKHGNNAEKEAQQDRITHVCPADTVTIPGEPVKCSYAGRGNQTILQNHCVVPAEADCPTECGYEGGSVADGDGGLKTCPATNSCSTYRWCYPDEESPTGYLAQAVSVSIPTPEIGKPWESGKMIDQYCGYTPAGECPTTCGYAGGEIVPDGQGGTLTCPATAACPDDDDDEDEDDDGEVDGITDEDKGEVKGTTDVVLAETGASDTTLVYFVQMILVLGTLVSSAIFVKKYML